MSVMICIVNSFRVQKMIFFGVQVLDSVSLASAGYSRVITHHT
jgi:hypothetical protein